MYKTKDQTLKVLLHPLSHSHISTTIEKNPQSDSISKSKTKMNTVNRDVSSKDNNTISAVNN